MKFAAIADVHGNRLALEAVLADIAAAGLTEVVNLGDHVSGPLEARRTADLLIERGFPSIRGDQDRRLAEFDIASTGAHRGDYLQLDRKHLNWPASLPPTMVYRDGSVSMSRDAAKRHSLLVGPGDRWCHRSGETHRGRGS